VYRLKREVEALHNEVTEDKSHIEELEATNAKLAVREEGWGVGEGRGREEADRCEGTARIALRRLLSCASQSIHPVTIAFGVRVCVPGGAA
jgi:hypothetical protein